MLRILSDFFYFSCKISSENRLPFSRNASTKYLDNPYDFVYNVLDIIVREVWPFSLVGTHINIQIALHLLHIVQAALQPPAEIIGSIF